MKSGKVLLGVLAGLAAGAIMGIVLAPDKGSKTRKQILSKSEDYADELKAKFNDFVSSFTDQYANTKQEAEELVSKGKAKYNEVKKEVHHESL